MNLTRPSETEFRPQRCVPSVPIWARGGIALCLAFGLTGLGAEPPASDPATNLSARLRVISADKKRGYQWLLRDATQEVRRVVLDRPWREVESVLRQEGLRRVRVTDGQYSIGYRYVVAKSGWVAGDGTMHSLYLDFSVDKRTPDIAPNAKLGIVTVAAAGLLVEPNRAYAKVLSSGAYPGGSALFRGLRLPEMAAAANRYPILKRIEIAYDYIRSHREENDPPGFHLDVTFGDSTRDERRGSSLYFSAPSGLDAPLDKKGKPVQVPFEPRDTVGEFRDWGSGEWK